MKTTTNHGNTIELGASAERPSPAGSLPASGSGAAERCPDQTRDTCSSSAPPFGGQGTGDLQRVLELIRKREAAADAIWQCGGGVKLWSDYEHHREIAAGLGQLGDMLAEAIGSPRPQSGADGDERCPACNGQKYFVWKQGIATGVTTCQCVGTGSRKERSGPPNTPDQPR